MKFDIAEAIDRATTDAGLSQRELAAVTGISQSVLSRIRNHARPAKLPELVLIAEATGTTLNALTGHGVATDRAKFAARSTNGAGMDTMRQRLLYFIELNDHLDDMGVPASR